ncbi:hypothetical protein B1R32_109119 [Abditibacterium utsteinense]|uniref:Uncharacterized protein n=1 Tax=Abditibacterium utsteinense TaxID=1960156 RepID=A0A2S8SSR5_9BACT|nr:hypothetical protein [Abditibacterium utsteinense]PQV63779.1 hypothetical protein B1R32_109119 [Abditibacterium utsteinense]
MPPETRNKWRSALNLFSPRGDFAGHAFHLQFTPFALSQSVTGVVPIALLATHGPAHLRVYAFAFLAFKISIGAVLSAAIISRFFPVTINEIGIRARNFWGMARVIPWHEMASVSPIRWLIFTSFARISTHHAKNWVWLPLFLTQQSEFEAQVLRFAPADNPLREFFEAQFHKK